MERSTSAPPFRSGIPRSGCAPHSDIPPATPHALGGLRPGVRAVPLRERRNDGLAQDPVTSGSWPLTLSLGLLPVVLFLAALILMDSYKLVTRRSVAAAIGAGVVAGGASYLFNAFLLSRGLDEMLLRRAVGPLVEE